MGLDIYISRRVFIGAMYRSRVITGKIELFSNGKLIPIKQELVSSSENEHNSNQNEVSFEESEELLSLLDIIFH